MKFLDTNIILRYLTRDDETKARACYELFQRVQLKKEEMLTTSAVVAELVYVLSSPRIGYRLSHGEIRDRLLPIVNLNGIRIQDKRACIRALNIYADHPFLDFEDALAVAHMEQRGIAEIVTYDRDFDHVAGIQRVEPH